MPLAGLEPARGEPLDFESSASANSATAAYYLAASKKPDMIISPLKTNCNTQIILEFSQNYPPKINLLSFVIHNFQKMAKI